MTHEEATAIVNKLWAEAEAAAIDSVKSEGKYAFMIGWLRSSVAHELIKFPKPKKP